MRCKPCGAPRNPSADRCDYCQSWHEVKRYDFGTGYAPGAVIEYRSKAELQSIQAQMMLNQHAQYVTGSYQSLLGSWLGRLG